MVRWMRWHCPPDTGFEIRVLAVWGWARYLSVTEVTPNSGVKGSGANYYPRAPAHNSRSITLQTRGTDPTLARCWTGVENGSTTSHQYWASVSCVAIHFYHAFFQLKHHRFEFPLFHDLHYAHLILKYIGIILSIYYFDVWSFYSVTMVSGHHGFYVHGLYIGQRFNFFLLIQMIWCQNYICSGVTATYKQNNMGFKYIGIAVSEIYCELWDNYRNTSAF